MQILGCREDGHSWLLGRAAALKRDDGTCRRCGRPGTEVNHIAQVFGDLSHGCQHHLSNLETLCCRCHSIVTAIQRAKDGSVLIFVIDTLYTLNRFHVMAKTAKAKGRFEVYLVTKGVAAHVGDLLLGVTEEDYLAGRVPSPNDYLIPQLALAATPPRGVSG